jgi:hypothetical protein
MSAAEPAALDHAARLERACRAEAWDARELVCLLREAVGRDDAKAAEDALCGLNTALELSEEERVEIGGLLSSHEPRLLEVAAADGAVVVFTAVQAFGLKTVAVVKSACFVLGELALLKQSDGGVVAQSACADVARIALRSPPATDVEVADELLAGMACLFEGSFLNDRNAELCAEALAAGIVERLLAGCMHMRDRKHRQACLYALEFLCGASRTPPDAALRIAQAGGLDVIFAAMAETQPQTPHSGVTLPDYAVDLLKALLRPTVSALDEPHAQLQSLIRGRDEETAKHLLVRLAGDARDDPDSAFRAVGALGMLAFIGSELVCKPALAVAAIDGILSALRTLQRDPDSLNFAAQCADALENFAGLCGEADAAHPGTYALRAGALPLLEAALATVDDDVDYSVYDSVDAMVLKLRGVRADAAMAELLAEEEAEAAARKAKAGKGAKSKAKAKASKSKSAGAATASKSPPAKSSTVIPAPAEQPMAPAPPAPVPAPPQPEPPQSSLPPPLPPWLMQAMQQPPAPVPAQHSPVAAPVLPVTPCGARPPNIAAALAATRISPPAAVPAPPQRWDAAATLPPAPPAGAWGRARPAIPGLSAGEVPRELECAICLDAVAEGRTTCCGQTAFCAACAATLRGECPLCRASR